jgi:peptidoglycan/LPS O-acetylase OafA/YrhL
VHTIRRRQEASNGVGRSFDILRLAAAVAVLVSHSVPLTTGSDAHELIFSLSNGHTTLGTLAVEVFFVTSGFLVTGSLSRSQNLLDFGWRRVARIVPALAVVVVSATFILGPLFTVHTMKEYFLGRSTYEYLLNAVFVFRPALPGVFLSLPAAGSVNGSLWTLFYEVACYVIVSLTKFFGRAATPATVIIFLVISICAIYPHWLGRLQHFVDLGSFFFAGATLYVLRDRVPYNVPTFALAGAISILIPELGVLPIAAPIALAYACVWLGFQRSIEPPGDYSYGIYLWAYPIQQICVFLGGAMPWWENVVLALPITAVLGYLSWTFVESRAMKSKNLIARFRTSSARAHGTSTPT